MRLTRGPGRPGAPTHPQTGSTVSVPIVSPDPGVATTKSHRRIMRGPGRPGTTFVRTRADSLYVEPPAVASASSYWGPHFPPEDSTFWDGNFPERPLATDTDIPPVGVAGAASFAIRLETGASVTYEWATDVFKAFGGKERRASVLYSPKQIYAGEAILVDDAMLATRSDLAEFAAQGVAFSLGLAYEEKTLTADASGNTVTVSSTVCDWNIPGQRVIVFGIDGDTAFEGSIQYSTATTFVLNDTVGSAGLKGGRIMPLVGIYLDPQQSFERSPTHVERWSIAARNVSFDFGEIGSIPAYATGTKYHLGDRVTSGGNAYVCSAVAAGHAGGAGHTAPTGTGLAITDGYLTWRYFATLDSEGYVPTMGADATVTSYSSKPVYDRGLDSASDSIHSLSELVDMGGVPINVSEASVPDWGRSIRIERSIGSEWQWFKAFLYAIRGMQKSFWLPSWRPDMTYVSRATVLSLTVLTVSGGDPVTWFPNHRSKLQLYRADGTVTYAGINSVVDNGDGTFSLSLDVLLTSTAVSMISWLELCRLESDSVRVVFSSTTFSADLQARVVQR